MAVLASAAPVQVDAGWSWTATVGVVQAVIVLVLGGGGLWGLFRGIGLLWRIHNERQAHDDSKDAAFRKEMAEQNDRMIARITKLEGDVVEERRRCDEELGVIRKAHEDEARSLRGHIEALQRIIVQMQISTGHAISLPANAPKATEAMERLTHQLNDIQGVGE